MQCLEPGEAVERLMELIEYASIYKNRYIKNSKFYKLKGDISERQYAILFAIKDIKIYTVSEMAKLMNLNKSTLSIIINKMVKKGYINKHYPENSQDKRKIYFYPSKLGVEKLEQLKKANIEEFKYMYSSFSDKQKENFEIGVEFLKKVSEEKSTLATEIVKRNFNIEDKIEHMVGKLALFFSSFIETNREIVKDEFNIHKNVDSITKNQFHLLVYIDTFNYDTVSKLETFLNSSGSTVSITISKLVENGYLYKEYPNKTEDGRIVYIRLTDKGKKIIKETKEKVKTLFINYFESLNQEEKKYLNKAIYHLLLVFNI